ncbi:hypothetical protein BGZ51_000453 [Haplosporangium sp. Z 767]|nr:hypothetical protein BGZ51_000453 [Haplosporangium sp. Z 767]KAF9196709.1 hypothetical protein BGZ50_007873 [Haplosporangium sp. Z 11]
MSCESCTGCFEATPCRVPSPSLNGHISKEYRHFLKAARICDAYLEDLEKLDHHPEQKPNAKKQLIESDKKDHAFNTVIGILSNNQFTAQTYLAQAYKQLGPSSFLHLSRSLAHHGFWGRLTAWAFLFVKEDSKKLMQLLDQQDSELLQNVNDEAEMFEVFNPSVSCQRVQWNTSPTLS